MSNLAKLLLGGHFKQGIIYLEIPSIGQWTVVLDFVALDVHAACS
jgi:hypothetical protein